MNDIVRIDIPVDMVTAAALTDERRRRAVGLLVDHIVQSGPNHPLSMLLAATAAEAQAAGITPAMVESELADYNAERRS